MKAILRQIVVLFLCLLGWFSLAYGLSLWLMEEEKYVDTLDAKSNINRDWYRTLCLDIWRLRNTDKPKMIFLGSSNSGMAFRPENLESVFPEYEISCCATPGASISDTRQTIEMIQMILPRNVLDESIFVIGMSYHLVFIRDEGNVRRSMLESGLYKSKGKKIYPLIGPDMTYFLACALRPFFFMQRMQTSIENQVENYARNMVRNSPKPLSGVQEESTTADFMAHRSKKTSRRRSRSDRRKFYVDYHTRICSVKDDRGFLEVLDICEMVRNDGGKLVLVDMPLPDWYRKRAPVHKKYQEMKGRYLDDALRDSHVRYINLLDIPELAEETMFFDGTHLRMVAMDFFIQSITDRWDIEPPAKRQK